jgi:hypothetical protein
MYGHDTIKLYEELFKMAYEVMAERYGVEREAK